jgi:mannose-6-phosphate isomerase
VGSWRHFLLQSHPDKTLAAQLFARDPTNYKDANHKPEMVIALTPFEAMCGFRPVAEIQANIKAYPELAALLGEDG